MPLTYLEGARRQHLKGRVTKKEQQDRKPTRGRDGPGMQGGRPVSPYCRDSGSGWKVKWATRRFWAASSPPGCRKPCTSPAQRGPHHRRSAPAARSRRIPAAREATAAIPGSQAPQPTLPAGRAELHGGPPHWAVSGGGSVKETNRRWNFGGGDGDAVTWKPVQTEARPRAL